MQKDLIQSDSARSSKMVRGKPKLSEQEERDFSSFTEDDRTCSWT